MRRLTEADSGTRVSLAAGETFTLELAENPTTGYRWRLDAGPAAVLQSVSDAFEPGRRPGEEGRHQWTLRAMGPGTATIAAKYQRGWAPGDPPARTFSLGVRVAA